MPQFDVTTFPSQIFWLIVTFSILYWLVVKRALPEIGRTIEERKARIATDLEEAERMQADAEAALAAYEEALRNAREEARRIVGEHRQKVQAELEEERQRIEAELAEKIETAKARILSAKEKALAEIEDAAADLAAEIVGRVAGEEVSPEEARKALAEVKDRSAA